MDEKSKSLWDRVCATVNKLGHPRSPRVRPIILPDPPAVLDLHGYSVHEAFYAVKDFVYRPHAPRVLTIITGKSGRIRSEFQDWCWQFRPVSSVTEMNGGGAFEVRLRKGE